MSFSLTILGSSSALPKPDRYTTAHALNVHERFFLIDCGEGTQLQLRRFRFRFGKIHHIFISHLHGDHFFGLPGLLSSFNLMGRKTTLHLYGPEELETILKNLYDSMGEKLNYPIEMIPVRPDQPQVLLDTKNVTVESVPLYHKKPATGFIFREKAGERNIDKRKIDENHLTIQEMVCLKRGENFNRPDGSVLLFEDLTTPAPKPLSYAFISDTRYDERIIPFIREVDLLYHEATYLHALKDRARVTGHSTAREAAQIALMANVRQLVIGHFSARYKDVSPLLEEAKSIFPNTIAAEDGLLIDVKNF